MTQSRSLPLVLLLLGATSPFGPIAAAGQIDLRLDVAYANGDPGAGGQWLLWAKSDQAGIFALRTTLDEVNVPATNLLPRGAVIGGGAGFSTFFTTPSVEPFVDGADLIAAQSFLPQGAPSQGLFYGVGTLVNGAPNYAGQPGGTTSIGPVITGLTNVQGVPWGNDTQWTAGVTVAAGTFSPGDQPAFGDPAAFEGSVFVTTGSSTLPGVVDDAVSFTTLVTTNIAFGVSTGDYNGDGVVDGADYTAWRDTLGQSVPAGTGADGNGDAQINGADYDRWLENFGAIAASAAAQPAAIPEPAGLVLAALAAFAATRRR